MTEKTQKRIATAMLIVLIVLLIAPLAYVVVDMRLSMRGWWEPGIAAQFVERHLEGSMRAALNGLIDTYHALGIEKSYAEPVAIITLMIVIVCILTIVLRLKKRSSKRVRATAKELWDNRPRKHSP